MQLGHVADALGQQRGQRAQPQRDVLEGDGLQLGAVGQRIGKALQRGLGRLAAVREPVQVARTVVVGQRRHARDVGLRLEVAPGDELGQRSRQLFGRGRRLAGPVGLGQHLFRAQLQPVLPLGRREHLQDRPVARRLLGAGVAQQVGGGGGQGHRGMIASSGVGMRCPGLRLRSACRPGVQARCKALKEAAVQRDKTN